MKNLTTNVILWLLSLFTLLLALGSFSSGILTGILFLIAAVLTNPVFLKILRQHHIRFKKIFYIPAVILIWFLGSCAFPASESDDPAQTQSETVEDVNAEIPTEDDTAEDTADGTDSASIAKMQDIDTDALVQDVPDADSDVPESGASDTLSELSIHFIDVGQGDATLVLCGGHAMLIDAGDNSKGTALQLYLHKQGVEKLDYLVLTHPDADHIGGADVIITKFDIDNIFMSDYTEDTKTYEEVLDALEQKNKNWSTPFAGDTYVLGDAAFTILSPLGTYSNSNDSSIALMLAHGDNTFLFTGDCSENAEDDLVAGGQNLSADIYQAGHHGSSYSSSQAFMDAVSPTYAVISCGEDNSYGHPGAETLNRFRAMGIQVFRTDEQGSIVASSDGTEITWNCAPSETWKAGEPSMSASAASQGNDAVVSNTQDSTADNTTSPSEKAAAASDNSAVSDAQAADDSTIPDTQDAAANSTAPDTQDAAANSTAPDTQDAAANSTAPDTQNTAPADNTPSTSGATLSGGSGSGANPFETGTSPGAGLYIGNKNNGKLHRSSCHKLPKNENQAVFDTREEAVAAGYNDPCKLCKP